MKLKPNRNLKKIRQSISMSQEELARLTKTSRSYIVDLESGRIKEPTIGRARLLAYYLDVDVETIFPQDRRFIK